MKRLIAFILILAIGFSLTACGTSNIHDFILVDNDEFLVMVTSADFAPFEFLSIDEQGRTVVVGLDIEIAKEIAIAANKNLRVIDRDFDFLLQDVASGLADLAVAGITPTDERRQVVDFSDVYFTTNQVLVVRSDWQDKPLNEFNIAAVRIGAQLGSVQADILADMFPNATARILPDVNVLFEDLNRGAIDALIVEESVANVRINTAFPNLAINDIIDSSAFAIAVAKGNAELLTIVNETIVRLEAEGQIDFWYNYFSTYEFPDEIRSIWTWASFSLLLSGLGMTLLFSILAVFIGFILAFIPAFMRLSNFRFLRFLGSAYVDVIRGTPLLVQVFIVYAIIQLRAAPIVGFDLSAFIPGLVAMVINCSAYIAEIIRGGVQAVDKGQTEAALSIGLTHNQVMRKVILPQAFKQMVPSLGNEFVTIVKETSIFAFLGVAELMFQVRIIQSRTFRTLQIFLVAAILYLVITIPLSKLMGYLEKRLKYETKSKRRKNNS